MSVFSGIAEVLNKFQDDKKVLRDVGRRVEWGEVAAGTELTGCGVLRLEREVRDVGNTRESHSDDVVFGGSEMVD